eukprot:5453108-Amphidinium_carterae.1
MTSLDASLLRRLDPAVFMQSMTSLLVGLLTSNNQLTNGMRDRCRVFALVARSTASMNTAGTEDNITQKKSALFLTRPAV